MNPPAITPEWKRKVAQDAIESLSAAKLARSICSQFRTRLNSSHEAFAASLRQVMLLFYLREAGARNLLWPSLNIKSENHFGCLKFSLFLLVFVQFCIRIPPVTEPDVAL